MYIPVWFGVLIVSATLSGLFAGLYDKRTEFGKQMAAYLSGVFMFYALAAAAFFLPQVESRATLFGAGFLSWASLVALGIFLGKKLRKHFDRIIEDPLIQSHPSWGD